MSTTKPKKPFFNAHAHVFTYEDVPPFLAKSIAFWPFYYLIHVPTFVKGYIFYANIADRVYRVNYKRNQKRINQIKRYLLQHIVTRILYYVVIIWLGVTTFFILFYLLHEPASPGESETWLVNMIQRLGHFLEENYVLYGRPDWFPKSLNIVFAIAVLLFVQSVQNIALYLLNQVRSFLHLLPGEKTKDLMARYLNMARFAFYEKEQNIFSKLRRQYPEGTHFVLLPMDMAYMGAGKVRNPYSKQMETLAALNKKEEVHAFVFIDPRRIREEGKAFFNYSVENGKVILKDCFIKKYIEDEGFAGFKIYPALGYFPFDEDLLALWKYAADNGIPIMTHGVKGIIYYRGNIKKAWNSHPVFTEYMGGDQGHQPLYFTQFKNEDFQVNFTHPMNYLCLLEEPLLRKLIGNGKSEKNKAIFGYESPDKKLKYDLSHLKVCFAHYGGEAEWNKFLEKDRDNFAQQLMTKPDSGIDFGPEKGEQPWGRYEILWKYADWYSIVSSMMIQYENFYADISYIVSNEDLYPILRSTISPALSFENTFTDGLTYQSREKLRKKVLFGSDFYVVRSQKADKDIFIKLKSYLTTEELDLIARDNPAAYMERKAY